MIISMGSLFEGIPENLPQELFETICTAGNVKIERIVSRGHFSPEGFWYDGLNIIAYEATHIMSKS